MSESIVGTGIGVPPVGTVCEVLFGDEGNWYLCTIKYIYEDGNNVVYKKENGPECNDYWSEKHYSNTVSFRPVGGKEAPVVVRPRYMVVYSDDVNDFEATVGFHMKMGYELHGGLAVGRGMFYQSMTRPKGERDE